MTPDEHKTKAEELAGSAAKIYALVGQITDQQGGLDPQMHAGIFREMQAVVGLAQVHATLAANPVDHGLRAL